MIAQIRPIVNCKIAKGGDEGWRWICFSTNHGGTVKLDRSHYKVKFENDLVPRKFLPEELAKDRQALEHYGR